MKNDRLVGALSRESLWRFMGLEENGSKSAAEHKSQGTLQDIKERLSVRLRVLVSENSLMGLFLCGKVLNVAFDQVVKSSIPYI